MIYDDDGVAQLFEGHGRVSGQVRAFIDHVGSKSVADFSLRRQDGNRSIVELWRATPRGLIAVREEGSSKTDGVSWRTRVAMHDWQALGGVTLVSNVDYESSTMTLQLGRSVEMEVPDTHVQSALEFVGAVLQQSQRP